MFRADRPPSTRTSVFGVSKLPPFSFDPIIDDVISSINKLWVNLFFAPGVTWVDIDDNKIPKTSPLWNNMDGDKFPQRTRNSSQCFI